MTKLITAVLLALAVPAFDAVDEDKGRPVVSERIGSEDVKLQLRLRKGKKKGKKKGQKKGKKKEEKKEEKKKKMKKKKKEKSIWCAIDKLRVSDDWCESNCKAHPGGRRHPACHPASGKAHQVCDTCDVTLGPCRSATGQLLLDGADCTGDYEGKCDGTDTCVVTAGTCRSDSGQLLGVDAACTGDYEGKCDGTVDTCDVTAGPCRSATGQLLGPDAPCNFGSNGDGVGTCAGDTCIEFCNNGFNLGDGCVTFGPDDACEQCRNLIDPNLLDPPDDILICRITITSFFNTFTTISFIDAFARDAFFIRDLFDDEFYCPVEED